MNVEEMFNQCAEMGRKVGRSELIKEMLIYINKNKLYTNDDKKLLFNFIHIFSYDVTIIKEEK